MRAFLLLLLASSTALADDAGLLRCRTIKESAARLACYDALAVPSSPGKAAATPASASTPPSSTSPGSASAPQARPQEKVEQFGLPQKDREVALEAIESTIPGRFEGWGPRENIRFANGQVWQIADDSKGYHDIVNPQVRVRRGALGAYYLEIQGTNRSPRVTRLR
jgi:hypothetical protein